MNKTNIEWCSHTWNPVTGCLHGCDYCYARGITQRFRNAFPNGFEPTFHENRLSEPAKLQTPSHIFTVSMGDLFGDWVPQEWIQRVFDAMVNAPLQHTYTILTKNPERLRGQNEPAVPLFVGTSLTGGQDTAGGWRLRDLETAPFSKKVVSLEPFLSPIPRESLYILNWIDWLIIGGRTGRQSFQPPAEWISPLVEWARSRGIPVFVKDNCHYPEVVREWPEGVPH